MRALLRSGPAPDGVFAASDLMAVGAMRVLRDAGLRVPEDVAVVGFDDSPVCRHTEPELTSVHQPVEEMGRVMADLLIARIAGEDVSPQTVLPTPRRARLGLTARLAPDRAPQPATSSGTSTPARHATAPRRPAARRRAAARPGRP